MEAFEVNKANDPQLDDTVMTALVSGLFCSSWKQSCF